ADTQDVLERIVTVAREMFHADYAVFWPYVESEEELTLHLPVREAVVAGVDPALVYEIRDAALPVGEVTRRVMRDGWFSVRGDDAVWASLPDISLRLIQRLGAESFEGLALVVGKEKLGVLYLGYSQSRASGSDEMRRGRALAFANHAALALKKAKLVDQVAKGQMIAKRVAELTALVDLEKT